MPTAHSSGTPIYYETKGEGPALVFAHGAGGNAAIWFNQIAHFASRFRTIAFDHRCFARTPEPGDHVTVHQFRDDLLAILDHLQIERAHLVGQSMGGFTVLRCALDAPDRVLSLTLSCTSGGIHNPNPTSSLRNLTATEDGDTSGVQATMAAATQKQPALMQLYQSINNFNTEFSWKKLGKLLDKDSVVQWDELSAITCPVLVISGAEDPLFPPEQLAAFVPHFGNGRIEIVNDAGHSPYFEQPEHFNALLERHLKEASRG